MAKRDFNNRISEEFANYLKNSSNMMQIHSKELEAFIEKNKELRQKIEQIKLLSNSIEHPLQEQISFVENLYHPLLTFLYQIREAIIIIAGGIDEKFTLVEPFECEKTYDYMIGKENKGMAYELKKRLDSFVQQINSLNPQFHFKQIAKDNFQDEPYMKDDLKDKGFLDAIKILPAIIIYITSFEIESQILSVVEEVVRFYTQK